MTRYHFSKNKSLFILSLILCIVLGNIFNFLILSDKVVQSNNLIPEIEFTRNLNSSSTINNMRKWYFTL